MRAIVVEGLTKTYKGKRGKVVEALKGMDLQVGTGEVFGFVGPNGAGKSTTIKLLVGLIRATSGSATICGRSVSERQARSNVGYLPEHPALYDFLTAREYLTFVAKMFGLGDDALQRRREEMLALVDLEEAADRPVRSYSKGMVQRLGIALALVHDPQVCILDEPMSGLDPLGRALVKNIILDLKRRGKTVFFSTHITADVETLCDRVGMLVDGRLELVDSVASILQRSLSGYTVRSSGAIESGLTGVTCENHTDSGWEYFVPKDVFNEFVALASSAGHGIESVETVRQGVEELFLSLAQ